VEEGTLACGENEVVPVTNLKRIYNLKRHEARKPVSLRTLEGEKVRRSEAQYLQ